jgi:hypothetical protein
MADGSWQFTSPDMEIFVVEMERSRYLDKDLPLPQWILDWDKAREEKNGPGD